MSGIHNALQFHSWDSRATEIFEACTCAERLLANLHASAHDTRPWNVRLRAPRSAKALPSLRWRPSALRRAARPACRTESFKCYSPEGPYPATPKCATKTVTSLDGASAPVRLRSVFAATSQDPPDAGAFGAWALGRLGAGLVSPRRLASAQSIGPVKRASRGHPYSGGNILARHTCCARLKVRHVTHRVMKDACRRSGTEGGESRDFIGQAGAFVTCLQIPEQRIRRGNIP